MANDPNVLPFMKLQTDIFKGIVVSILIFEAHVIKSDIAFNLFI